MIYIPGGHFTMGPFHGDSVTTEIGPYLIGKHEVTNGEYRAFCELFHIPFAAPTSADSLPVVNVDMNAADAFAAWKGFRLPTEAEWEFAARGTEERCYPWGDAWLPGNANTASPPSATDRSRGGDPYPLLAPVGAFPTGASPFGVLDMVGNVWEWTADCYAPYTDGFGPNRRGPQRGTTIVIRGGSYRTPPAMARTTVRARRAPGTESDDVGFRLASDYPPREPGELPQDTRPTMEVDVGGE